MGEPLSETEPLSEKKKIEIRLAIQAARDHKDRAPEEIIKTDYKGDKERYLRDMANWLEIET